MFNVKVKKMVNVKDFRLLTVYEYFDYSVFIRNEKGVEEKFCMDTTPHYGAISENTKNVESELTVGADETAETFKVKARVMVGDIAKDLEATVYTREGGDVPEPTPEDPTEPTVTMKPLAEAVDLGDTDVASMPLNNITPISDLAVMNELSVKGMVTNDAPEFAEANAQTQPFDKQLS
jgi:hypothetical protein